MMEGWRKLKLVDVTETFCDGDWIESKDQSVSGIRLIQTGNVGNGLFKDRAEKGRFISLETFKRLRCTEIFSGDCLISRLPDPVGRACIIPVIGERMITAVDCTIVRFNKSLILPEWFVYFSLSNAYSVEIDKQTTGATRQRVSRKNLSYIEIPLPPLPEQKRIVALLDEAFAVIDRAKANLEKNLQNAKELFESYLQKVFTEKGEDWEEKTLSDVALQFGRGKSKHRPRNDKKLYGGQYPFVQTGDVRNSNKYITSYSQTYNETGLAQSKLWTKGTICITIAANIAETGILSFDSCFPDSMIGLIVNPSKADVSYTYYALQYMKSTLQMLGKGSAQDNINVGTFENQTFPFPSVVKQKQIAIVLDNILEQSDQLHKNYFKKIKHLELLKKSLLQKAFTGELTSKEIVAA